MRPSSEPFNAWVDKSAVELHKGADTHFEIRLARVFHSTHTYQGTPKPDPWQNQGCDRQSGQWKPILCRE